MGLTDSHVLFDLCGAYSTCLTCYSQRVSQSEPDTQVFPESEAAWRVVDEQREQKRKKKMDGLGQKMEESMMDDTLFRVSSVRGLSLAL